MVQSTPVGRAPGQLGPDQRGFRGHGCAAITVRRPADLAPVGGWLAGPRGVPRVLDLKVAAGRLSWWSAAAFRGH